MFDGTRGSNPDGHAATVGCRNQRDARKLMASWALGGVTARGNSGQCHGVLGNPTNRAGAHECREILFGLQKWCPGAESNHRHEDFQSTALPLSYPGTEAAIGARSGRCLLMPASEPVQCYALELWRGFAQGRRNLHLVRWRTPAVVPFLELIGLMKPRGLVADGLHVMLCEPAGTAEGMRDTRRG